MTSLLQMAFAAAERLTEAEQNALATRLLAELTQEDEFDLALSQTGHKLAGMARQALEELRSGQTQPIPLDAP